MPDSGFHEAAHGSATIPNNSGPVFATPTLVTITFKGRSGQAFAQQLGSYLVTSPWLGAVGPEYGIGFGTNVNIVLPQTAPDTIDDTTIQGIIASLILDGTAPSPTGGTVIPVSPGSPLDDGGIPEGGAGPLTDDGGDAQPPVTTATLLPAIYMVYIPTTTAETAGGAVLCDVTGGGYHSQATGSFNGETFAYAIVSQCSGAPPSEIQQAVSHEFIEAATDPAPLTAPAWDIQDPFSIWGTVGGEVGDLCAFVAPQWAEGAYTGLQRVYSNTSANSGGDPCLPAVGTYLATDNEPQYLVTVNAGETATFTVTGWSTGPLPDWGVNAGVYTSGNYVDPTAAPWTPTSNLTTATMNNGEEAKLSVTVPPGTPSQSYALVGVVSEDTSETTGSYAIVGVYVQ